MVSNTPKRTIIEKIGKVSIGTFRNSLFVRFTFEGKQHNLTLAKYSKEALKAVIARAKEIDADLAWNRVPKVLEASKTSHTANNTASHSETSEPSLLEVWEQYKKLMKDKHSASTKKKVYPTIDKTFERLEDPNIPISSIQTWLDRWALPPIWGKLY
jgi:hypothetical protein